MTKAYEEQRYERLLESIDEYVCTSDSADFKAFIPDIRRALTELKQHPISQIKQITEIQEFFSRGDSSLDL
jgi:hypothetical protein